MHPGCIRNTSFGVGLGSSFRSSNLQPSIFRGELLVSWMVGSTDFEGVLLTDPLRKIPAGSFPTKRSKKTVDSAAFKKMRVQGAVKKTFKKTQKHLQTSKNWIKLWSFIPHRNHGTVRFQGFWVLTRWLVYKRSVVVGPQPLQEVAWSKRHATYFFLDVVTTYANVAS